MEKAIKTMRELISKLEIRCVGDVFTAHLPHSTVEIAALMNSAPAVFLSKILPVQSIEVSNEEARLGRLLSPADIEGCLSFDAEREFGEASEENRDLVRNRLIPIFLDCDGSPACISSGDDWMHSRILLLQKGHVFETNDPDERVKEAQLLPVALGDFFDYLIAFRGEGSLAEDEPL
jgi:hypothetical protein